MPTRGLMFFVSRTINAGWTEDWFLSASDLDGAMASLQNIADERIKFLGRNYDLEWLRVTDNIPLAVPAPPRRQRSVLLDHFQKRGLLGTTADSGDTPWEALKVRFQSTDKHCFRVQNLRGVPDSLWSGGGPVNLKAAMGPYIQPYNTKLVVNGAQIRHVNNTSPKTFTYFNVSKAIIEDLSRRATGRPSFLPRGRRSKRR